MNDDYVNTQDQMEIEALLKQVEELEGKIEKYKEALIFCSGSSDFSWEGKARIGWERLCEPLLSNNNETRR